MGREGGIIDLAIFSLLFFFSIKKIYNKNKNKESNEIESSPFHREMLCLCLCSIAKIPHYVY
jgi:hypothetical protein